MVICKGIHMRHTFALFQPPRYHKTKYGANPPVEHHVGWVFGTRCENQKR